VQHHNNPLIQVDPDESAETSIHSLTPCFCVRTILIYVDVLYQKRFKRGFVVGCVWCHWKTSVENHVISMTQLPKFRLSVASQHLYSYQTKTVDTDYKRSIYTAGTAFIRWRRRAGLRKTSHLPVSSGLWGCRPNVIATATCYVWYIIYSYSLSTHYT